MGQMVCAAHKLTAQKSRAKKWLETRKKWREFRERKKNIRSESFHFFFASLCGVLFSVVRLATCSRQRQFHLWTERPGALRRNESQPRTVGFSSSRKTNSFEVGFTIATNWWQTAANKSLQLVLFLAHRFHWKRICAKNWINSGYRFHHVIAVPFFRLARGSMQIMQLEMV